MTTNEAPTKLVIIDDDPSMIRLIQSLVEGHFTAKISVDSFVDPEEGVAHILGNKTDIVLTDLEMPGINGLEILKTVKGRNPFAQVLLLTGNSNHESVLEALEHGASDYLLKPVDKDMLFELLEQSHKRQLRWQRALAETWRKRRQEAVKETVS